MSPGSESRPTGSGAADVRWTATETTVAPAIDAGVLARRRWAYRMLSRCAAPPPVYGSAAWLALPEGSVEKVAAVVRAAECWATDGDHLAENLRVEVEAATVAAKQLEDAAYAARRDAHRAEWAGRDMRPHPVNRRGEMRRTPRLDDRPAPVICLVCGTPTSPWTCSCGATRVGGWAS